MELLTILLASMMSYENKSHVLPYFDCVDIFDTIVPLTMVLASYDGNAGITLCQNHHQWCHMTKNIILHLILIFMIYLMQWCH